MNNLLPMFVAIPLGVAFAIPLFSRALKWSPDVLGNVVMLLLAFFSFHTIGDNCIYHMGGWATPLGIDLRLDGLSSLMLMAINVIGLAAALFSVAYMTRYTSKWRYYSLFL